MKFIIIKTTGSVICLCECIFNLLEINTKLKAHFDG